MFLSYCQFKKPVPNDQIYVPYHKSCFYHFIDSRSQFVNFTDLCFEISFGFLCSDQRLTGSLLANSRVMILLKVLWGLGNRTPDTQADLGNRTRPCPR